MLQLPNEILSHVAAFTQDEDLLSLRLTCKLLESLTYKHFVAAFMTEIHFSASLAGIQRLENKIAHPKFGPCIRTIMASVTEDRLVQKAECRALLTDIFAEVARSGHGSRLGVSCCLIRIQSLATAIRAVDFARLMFDAKPPELPLEKFVVDLSQLPPDDSFHDFSGISPHPGISSIQRDVDVLLLYPDQVMGSSLNLRCTITEGGTCFKFNDLECEAYLFWASLLWPTNHSVKKVHVKHCNLSISTLVSLLAHVKSSSWHLELKNCHFIDPCPWTNKGSLFLKRAFDYNTSGLTSCSLRNLTSQSGPILADDLEASKPNEIRKRMSTIKFFEQTDVDEGAS